MSVSFRNAGFEGDELSRAVVGRRCRTDARQRRNMSSRDTTWADTSVRSRTNSTAASDASSGTAPLLSFSRHCWPFEIIQVATMTRSCPLQPFNIRAQSTGCSSASCTVQSLDAAGRRRIGGFGMVPAASHPLARIAPSGHPNYLPDHAPHVPRPDPATGVVTILKRGPATSGLFTS